MNTPVFVPHCNWRPASWKNSITGQTRLGRYRFYAKEGHFTIEIAGLKPKTHVRGEKPQYGPWSWVPAENNFPVKK